LALTQTPERDYVASVAAFAARWLQAPSPSFNQPHLTLRDLLGDPARPLTPPTGARTFAAGGLTIWRRARPDGLLLLAFDHGPLGYLSIAAHGHADALAVWLSWGEEAVLVDPGMHLYHVGAGLRDALRSTRAHNTLTIAQQDQSRIIGPFAWSHHARTRLIKATDEGVEAEHDGYRRRFGLIHRRHVSVNGDAILIEDRLLGRANTPHLPWSLGFTVAPGVQTALHGSRVDLCTRAGRRLSLISDACDGVPAPWRAVQTPFAPAFGSLQSTTRLELAGRLQADPLVARIVIHLAS
jgi:hypothetical protein